MTNLTREQALAVYNDYMGFINTDTITDNNLKKHLRMMIENETNKLKKASKKREEAALLYAEGEILLAASFPRNKQEFYNFIPKICEYWYKVYDKDFDIKPWD